MKKIKTLSIILPIIGAVGASFPLVALTSCNKPETEQTYSVSYGTDPDGLTWTNKSDTCSNKKNFTATFTLASNYSINKTSTRILCGTSIITSSCTITNTSITIPYSKINNNITITVATKLTQTYDVQSSVDANFNNWSCPTSILSSNNLVATYTLTDGYIVDTEKSVITVGDVDVKPYISYTNGTLIIPSSYLSGKVVIDLVSKTEAFTGDWKSTDSSATVTDNGAGKTVSHVYEIAPSATSNGTVNVTLTGDWTNTQILIRSAGTYNITLNNCLISNTKTTTVKAEQPFLIDKENASGESISPIINIILAESSENTINDKRTDTTVSFKNDVALQSKSTGAITIKGYGTLNINNANNNKGPIAKGIQTKGDLTITDEAEVNVYAQDTAIQAGGALTIDNATVIATSYYDDGIKTKYEDAADDLALAGNGNIKRDIKIAGNANVTVNAGANAISAAHDFITEQNDSGTPTINLYTSTNTSGKTAGVQKATEQTMYVAIPASSFNYSNVENYYFTATFTDSNAKLSDTVEYMTLKKIKKEEGQPGQGSGTLYWFLKCDRPLQAYTNVTIKQYPKAQYGAETTATATSKAFTISSGSSFNSNDTIICSGISGSTISSSYSTFSKNYKAMIGQPSSHEESVGAKGIKTKNNISIPTGEINIKSTDTCITAGYGDIFVNSSTTGDIKVGQGNINISGGSIIGSAINNTTASGDGIKSNGKLTVSGGQLSITKAVEALEAGEINITGGETKLVASDDGMNASQVGKYYTDLVTINVSGGILDVRTDNSQDTDAIDSNNNINITGGLVITRVPGSGMNAALDWETGNIPVDNATIIALGKVEISKEQGATISVSPITSGYSSLYSAGNHTIKYYTTSGSGTYTFYNASSASTSASNTGVYVKNVTKPEVQ